MQHKIIRFVRKTRWSMRPAKNTPIVWHCGRPNFGDDINPELFTLIGDQPLRKGRLSAPHLLGMGSVLERGNEHSVVMGSGLIEEPAISKQQKFRSVVAVRGELTAQRIGDDKCLLGDPMVLVDKWIARNPQPNFPVGIVPHASEVKALRRQAERSIRVIDVRQPPWKVVQMIGDCETVLSQSLHGLIVADALGIPNAWIGPSERMKGGEFKFHDYYSTTDKPKSPIRWRTSLLADAPKTDTFVSNYRHNKAALLNALREAIHLFAAEC